MPVSCRNLGFHASFRIMDENDVCFHYFHLSIHKLPDDEIVLFGCFIGWSGFSWMVFRFSNKKHLRTPTSFEKCLDVRIQFKVHQTHRPMPRFHWCYQLISTSNKSHKVAAGSRNFVLGDFFVVDVDSKAGIGKIFLFCWSQRFPFPHRYVSFLEGI